MTGLLIKAISSFYYVEFENKIYECKARGNFRNSGISPLVGDKVGFQITSDKNGVIEKILDRKNSLKRPLIANLDKIFIVSSFECPAPDLLLIDRLTATAEYNGIEPIIVFNKADTGDFSEYKKIYEKSGFKTLIVSAKENDGIALIKNELKDSICAFAGNSGVGKSSIINSIFGNDFLQIGEVSQKLGRGRHTTRHSELFKNEYGGYIADTPGFSSFEGEKEKYDFKINLADCFRDFREFTNDCRFSSCTHICEKGCAVVKAVQDGEIQKTRHESYKALFDEMKDIKEWTK